MDSHSFNPPSSSPSTFFTPFDPPPPVQPGPRSYKSRKYRPCDFCRARQVACKIDSAPPCQLCSSHGRQCTFVERPKKKRRANGPGITAESSRSGGSAPVQLPQFEAPQTHMNHVFKDHYDGSQQSFSRINSDEGRTTGLQTQPSSSQIHHDSSGQNVIPMYNMDPYLQLMPPGMRIRPLDSQLTRSARFVGETGESNPCLLQHYRYDENDECIVSKLTFRRIKTTPDQNTFSGHRREPAMVFMLADDSLSQEGQPRVEDDVLANAHSDITRMFSEDEALRLVALFIRFVYPYFPILSRFEICPAGEVSPSVLHTLPLSLLAAIYAAALPFVMYDELLATTLVLSPPPADQLFRYSWLAIIQEMNTPRLATLQACLLLLQRAPSNRYITDTPFHTSLAGWTVSLAQILGLHKECSDWASVPRREVYLRRRLWHSVFIMDKWVSLCAGMPSHIRKEEFDVLPLTPQDVEHSALDPYLLSSPSFREAEVDYRYFLYLSDLTIILSDTMDSFYSVRASQRTSRDFRLSLDIAHPLQSRLRALNDSLPPVLNPNNPGTLDSSGMVRLSSNPSLLLAYLVTSMTIFRALLRPLEILGATEKSDPSITGHQLAVRTGAHTCANEAINFVENLGPGALDAFWHSWSRANFAIASSFLLQLLLSAESEAESNEMHALIERWRWAMRAGGGREDGGLGLMSLGLLRLDDEILFENDRGQAGGG